MDTAVRGGTECPRAVRKHRGGEGVIGFNGLQENEVQVEEATIKKVDVGKEKVDLLLLPIRGKDRAELTLEMQCNVKRLPLRYTLDLSEPH